MFSDENDFRENDIFSVFGCISENAPESILQKGWGEAAFLENGLRTKNS